MERHRRTDIIIFCSLLFHTLWPLTFVWFSPSICPVDPPPGATGWTGFGYWMCSWIRDPIALLTYLLVTLTSALAAYTYRLWGAAVEQASLTQQMFILEKRAFVHAVTLIPYPEIDSLGLNYNWRFRPLLRNAGETNANHVSMCLECVVRNTPLPYNYDFSNLSSPIGSGFFGPKMDLEGGSAPPTGVAAVTPADIEAAQGGEKFIYLIGWINYFDIFTPDLRHETHYCWQVIPVGNAFKFSAADADGTAGRPVPIKFNSLHHEYGNYINHTKINLKTGLPWFDV
jgi:hypothetical protein